MSNHMIVICPSKRLGEYWTKCNNIYTPKMVFVTPYSQRGLRGRELTDKNYIIIQGREYDYPEMTLDRVGYGKWYDLLREVKRRLNEK